MFALMVPEMIEGGSMRFSTSEFAKLYAEREGLLAELRNFQPEKLAHELTDPEVKEFLEYLHHGWESGME